MIKLNKTTKEQIELQADRKLESLRESELTVYTETPNFWHFEMRCIIKTLEMLEVITPEEAKKKRDSWGL